MEWDHSSLEQHHLFYHVQKRWMYCFCPPQWHWQKFQNETKKSSTKMDCFLAESNPTSVSLLLYSQSRHSHELGVFWQRSRHQNRRQEKIQQKPVCNRENDSCVLLLQVCSPPVGRFELFASEKLMFPPCIGVNTKLTCEAGDTDQACVIILSSSCRVTCWVT